MRQPDGTEAVKAQSADAVVAAVAEVLTISVGWERALTAALGPLAEALAVRSHAAAAGIFDRDQLGKVIADRIAAWGLADEPRLAQFTI